MMDLVGALGSLDLSYTWYWEIEIYNLFGVRINERIDIKKISSFDSFFQFNVTNHSTKENGVWTEKMF